MIENTVQDVKEFNQSHWNVIWQSYWIHIYVPDNIAINLHIYQIDIHGILTLFEPVDVLS